MSTCISHKSLPLCFHLVGDHGHGPARSFKAVLNKGTNGQRAHLPTPGSVKTEKFTVWSRVPLCTDQRIAEQY